MVEYSVVVPIYNEEGNIIKLHSEIKEAMDKISKDYEIIYINDASSDNSSKELKSVKKAKIIELNRNYGQATALDAGFRAAKGEIIISMDGDGQNDPKDISRLLKKMEDDGLDVVAGWRKSRADKGGIKVLTRIGRLLRKLMIKDSVHDTGCTLRVYKKRAIDCLEIQGEMHRYILALLKWKGFKIGELIVNDRAREHGKSKYGYSKAFRGFLDLIYMWFMQKYSQRPLHIYGYASMISIFMGIIITVWAIYLRIFSSVDLTDSAWLILGMFFLGGGILLFTFGMMFDLMIRTYLNCSPVQRNYYVRETVVIK
jgi:glycosyltransferase involved in cell wall biosynthesis